MGTTSGRIVLLSPSSDFIYSTESFTLSPGLLADLMLCLICIASHVLSSCEFGSKSSHLLCYRNLYFSWCVSRIICGVHLQRPLFLRRATGSCIRCPVTPVNPVVGFKLVVIFGLICDRCNRWVSVQLPNVISTGFCEWDGERRIFIMEREIETDGLTLERREDVMTDVSTMEYKEAKPRHAARRKIELNSNHTACNARGPQDQKSQWEVLPFSNGTSFPFFFWLMCLSLAHPGLPVLRGRAECQSTIDSWLSLSQRHLYSGSHVQSLHQSDVLMWCPLQIFY